jgi:hypothetical protein
MKIGFAAIAFFVLLAQGASAWGENHCFWDGREIHCRPGWVFHDGREMPANEWQERMRHHEHEHDHDEWNYRR